MHLSIVPDPSNVLFILIEGDAIAYEMVPPARFLDALMAVSAATDFGTVCSAAVDPAELLPWAGNV